MSEVLRVRDLKVYIDVDAGTVKAVDGVSFRIPAGGTMALVGESGSGKSIVAQAIMGILPRVARIEQGEILFSDPARPGSEVDISRLDPGGREMQSIRGGCISIIFQEPMTALSPLHTIGNQIGEALALHRSIGKAERRVAVIEMLRLVGFPDPVKAEHTYPFELSGGLRQRAMIAMALVCRPALLIADEPTTALDVTIQAQILQLIKQLQGELRMAMMIITHDLGIVANMADEVVVMYHGKVMESGTLEDVFRDPRHPYLVALMRAVPRFNMVPGERLTPIREIHVTAGHLLDARDSRPSPAGDMDTPMLEVRNLTKRFETRKRSLLGSKLGGETLAVDDLSLHVRAGECLGLVGESGCGKTTAAKMILRSITPDAGEIVFNDRGKPRDVLSLQGSDLFDYRRRVQFVFQDPYGSLNPRMTVYDIVSEPLVIHGIGGEDERFSKVKELMTVVGLDVRFLRRYPHSFSGGQRQRIGIARALALRPDLLICDEPVSALDVSVQAQVLNLLLDLRGALNLTYLFISHNLAVVHYIADRIAVMCAGLLVEIAPFDELFRNPVHPYTKALLAAVPDPDLSRKLDFAALMEGKASDPGAWPDPFRLGSANRPGMIALGEGHLVRASESANASELRA
ncbi:MAG: ABC transporter ATP-binding protein [Betaproteobacteria bacterium]|nr:ABC transporter ATP-binding protein [Betaproteobacteria bacterium]